MRLARPLALIASLALAGAAFADYPPPGNPNAPQGKPKGPFHTLKVCPKKGHKPKGCFKKIQKAINKAKPGDTVKVPNGRWKEGLQINGAKKRYLKLIGNISHPSKVVLEGKGLKGVPAQNGVLVNGASHVTIRGLQVQHYKANGIFVVNVLKNGGGYKIDDVIAKATGTYGIYAFNTIGGEMKRDVAAWNDDSGFYIGQTPKQTKPIRSIVDHVISYGNVLGWSGTNMRYVTIKNSQWFNNGLGIVPNTLKSEKFPPEEDNVISNNDVFWNNFDYFKAAPFKLREGATMSAYPVGTGILLFGGRRNVVTANRIYGHYLLGAGMIEQVDLLNDKNPAFREAAILRGNQIKANAFGLNGTDINNYDLFYDGSGTDNCVADNTGVQKSAPADQSTYKPCPFTGTNNFEGGVLLTAAGWVPDANDPNADHEKAWVKHPHATATISVKPPHGAAIQVKPLETYTPGHDGDYGP